MLPSGNDAAMALAENIGSLIYLENKGRWDEVKEKLWDSTNLN
jgi:hypothetical protein